MQIKTIAKKKVLLLCAGHNDLGLVRALRKMGFYIIITGFRDNAPGEKWADKWIKADYSDKELILSIAKEEKIDNIVACCNDYGVYTAAYVAEKLNLPGYDSYENTLTLNNKDKFKKFALENDILTPYAQNFSTKEAAVEYINQTNLPVIIKPVDCSAGNGVSVIKNADGICYAIENAFSCSREGRIVVEQYIEGSQHGFCTFLVNKKVAAICSNNEYSIINPFRVEIDTYPSDTYAESEQLLVEEIEKIANLLDLKDGIFHLQYMYMDNKPWILEVMRRTIGNMYHVLGNQLNGINWEYWEAKARCGMDCSDFPQNIKQEGHFAYKTILATQNGVIESIDIPDEYNKYIFDRFMLKNEGDSIDAFEKEPVGFLFMMFGSDEEMHNVLVDNYRSDFVRIGERKNE